MPVLFYGDEGGLYGYNDPYNRKPMNWESQDIELLEWFRGINSLREKYPALTCGDMRFVYIDADTVAQSRFRNDEELIYIMNIGPQKENLVLCNRPLTVEEVSYKMLYRNAGIVKEIKL